MPADYPPLYVLRHGETSWNVEGRFQGTLDSPLTARGVAQARAQRAILQKSDLTRFTVASSPRGRALHTASLALDGLVSPIVTDARLAEIGVGAWEGLRRMDIAPGVDLDENDGSALWLYERAPGGEGFAALRKRCASFLGDLTAPTVIVTHGITSRMLRLAALGRPTDDLGAIPGGQGVVFYLADGRQRKLR